MSKFHKSKSKDSQKSESSKDNQSKNQGPAGFSLFEYQGPGKDHANAWLRFKRDLKSGIVQNKLDDMLEKIIDEGIDPQVEELDLNELMKSAPSKFNKVKVATLDQDDFVSDLNDSEQESKISKSDYYSSVAVVCALHCLRSQHLRSCQLMSNALVTVIKIAAGLSNEAIRVKSKYFIHLVTYVRRDQVAKKGNCCSA